MLADHDNVHSLGEKVQIAWDTLWKFLIFENLGNS